MLKNQAFSKETENILYPLISESKEKIIVTGASSFLAEPVIRRLRKKNCQVVAVSRSNPVATETGEEWISYDSLTKFIVNEGHVSGALIHLAPLWALPGCIPRSGPFRIVAIGSSSVETKRNSPNQRERAVVEKLIKAEQHARELASRYGHSLTVIHPTMIYDPAARDNNIGRLVRFAKRYRLLPTVVPSPGLRQPVHADDLAQLCVAALDSKFGDDRLVVGGGEIMRYDEMMQRIAVSTGARLVKVPAGVMQIILEGMGRLPFGPELNGAMISRLYQDLCFENKLASQRYGYAPRKFAPAYDID